MTAAPRRPSESEGSFETFSAEQTTGLGEALGRRLHRGHTLLLFGELGSGKTAFAQGVGRGLGIPADTAITSPTYTLINAYRARLPFYHADLYRLPEPVDPETIGLAELFDQEAVTVVEWADRLDPADRPGRRLEVHFTVTGDRCRSIRVIGYGLDPADLLKDSDIRTPPPGENMDRNR